LAGQFDGKVALVTGAASGIGRASAIAFAKEGARVVVADVNAARGAETVDLVRGGGGEGLFVETDVTKSKDVGSLIETTLASFGRLDYAHNNAGMLGKWAMTADVSEEDWDRLISVNLKSVFLCMRLEIPRMLEAGGGSIVNTASSSGLVATRGLPVYTASKHGVAGLTKNAAVEYVRQGIRVNAVCPGFIDTPMVRGLDKDWPRNDVVPPIGRLGTPEEVAAAVVCLCSDAASYVTGHLLSVDGAFTTI
jgi:NAD(P)-dependent dehydrogenase (short-subunit alcohol dehydrogenase family)